MFCTLYSIRPPTCFLMGLLEGGTPVARPYPRPPKGEPKIRGATLISGAFDMNSLNPGSPPLP
jgi:hypothetical protein